jgi:hypothetical protein
LVAVIGDVEHQGEGRRQARRRQAVKPLCPRRGADKAIAHMRRILLRAVKTAADGGIPPGVAPAYYTLTTGLDVLPKDADWRAALAPDMTPEKILQTV